MNPRLSLANDLNQLIQQGDLLEVVRFLELNKISPSITEEFGIFSGLYWAIEVNSREIFEYLLLAGADPNYSTDENETAAEAACLADEEYFYLRLLAIGVNFNERNKYGASAQDYLEKRRARPPTSPIYRT